MITDAFVIRLPDGTLHYARPGHVNALCGANRVSNADRWTGTVEDVCPACSLLRGREADEQRDRAVLSAHGVSPVGLVRLVECPDCSTPWPIDRGEPCPGCGLSEEDVEAAADFWVALGPGEL